MEMQDGESARPVYDFAKGAFLLVDKPQGWTSFDVVNKIRGKIKKRLGVKKIKVGHAGTLDPMATGLLIICTGKYTKRLQEYQNLSKVYSGTLRLGATTPSFDAETAVDATYPTDHIDLKAIRKARKQFVGTIEQVPPMFSAIKVDGQPLYKKARKGETVAVEPREVTIYDFEILDVEMPEVHFRIHSSKGTYIRSLAHDFGRALRSGAYLTRLRREGIGNFQVENAWDLNELTDYIKSSPNIAGAVAE